MVQKKLLATDKKIQFRDAAIFLNSSTDGQLDIDADGTVQINTATLDIDASSSVNISGATTAEKISGAYEKNQKSRSKVSSYSNT